METAEPMGCAFLIRCAPIGLENHRVLYCPLENQGLIQRNRTR